MSWRYLAWGFSWGQRPTVNHETYLPRRVVGRAGAGCGRWRTMRGGTGNATVYSHVNQVESATAFTNNSGSLVNERLYYPWGRYWTEIGPTMEEVYGGITDDQELYDAQQQPALAQSGNGAFGRATRIS